MEIHPLDFLSLIISSQALEMWLKFRMGQWRHLKTCFKTVRSTLFFFMHPGAEGQGLLLKNLTGQQISYTERLEFAMI